MNFKNLIRFLLSNYELGLKYIDLYLFLNEVYFIFQ